VPRLQQFHRKPRLRHSRMEPLRQRSSFQSDPLCRRAICREPADQRLGLAQHLGLTNDPPLRVDNANAGEFQRHVDPGIVLHGRLSMMFGAGPKSCCRG